MSSDTHSASPRFTSLPLGERWLIGAVAVLLLLIVQLIAGRRREQAYVRSLQTAPSFATLGSDSATTVALVFRLNDCSSNIESLRRFNAAHATRQIRVQAVVLDTPEDSASLGRILGGSGIRFPIRPASDPALGRALVSLGHRTPAAIIIDRQKQVRLIAPAAAVTSRAGSVSLLEYVAALDDTSNVTKALLASR